MYEKLKDRIKTHEGFRNFCYKDSLGKKTVGWGHLCKSDENWNDDEPKAKEVIVEMVFQLGKGGVSKFKKMWEALAKEDYTEAANQMLDSRWHKQTKSRAESLASIMRSLA